MAQSDDDRRQWVDGKLAKLAPDSAWTPNASRGLEQLRRADRPRRPWGVWTAVAVTATILFAIPNPTLRAFAHKCGVFVARVTGFDYSRRSLADLTLKGFEGQATKLSASRGNVVVLTIWPPACARCETERSWFDEFQRDYRARGLTVLGASLEHDGPAIGVSVPTTLILDRSGGIAVTHGNFCSKADTARTSRRSWRNDVPEEIKKMRRIPLITLLFAVALFGGPFRGWSGEAGGPKHARPVRVTMRNGSSELVQLEGVGCVASICSRVAINGHISLDRLDEIRDVCDGHAQLVFSDGTEQDVTVIPGNRVLYVTGADGRAKKIHLDALKSLRFTSRASQ